MFYHQSRTAVTDGLNQPTPRQGPSLPTVPVYMVFQPMRLAIVPVAGIHVVGSYPTFSPLLYAR